MGIALTTKKKQIAGRCPVLKLRFVIFLIVRKLLLVVNRKLTQMSYKATQGYRVTLLINILREV